MPRLRTCAAHSEKAENHRPLTQEEERRLEEALEAERQPTEADHLVEAEEQQTLGEQRHVLAESRLHDAEAGAVN